MHHSLSFLAAWKPHQCTSSWRHRLKPKRRNMFIRNQRGMSISWNDIWLKYGQQPAELHWSIIIIIIQHLYSAIMSYADTEALDRSMTRLFYCVSQRQKQTLWAFAMMCFSMICNCHDFQSLYYCCYKQIDLRFVSQGRVSTAVRRGGQFCKFTKVSLCQKLWKYCEVWQIYCKNNNGAIFCLSFLHKTFWRNSHGVSLNGGVQCGWSMKKPISHFISETIQDKARYYNAILPWTCTRLLNGVLLTLRDLAKCSTTRSVTRILCDSWTYWGTGLTEFKFVNRPPRRRAITSLTRRSDWTAGIKIRKTVHARASRTQSRIRNLNRSRRLLAAK